MMIIFIVFSVCWGFSLLFLVFKFQILGKEEEKRKERKRIYWTDGEFINNSILARLIFKKSSKIAGKDSHISKIEKAFAGMGFRWQRLDSLNLFVMRLLACFDRTFQHLKEPNVLHLSAWVMKLPSMFLQYNNKMKSNLKDECLLELNAKYYIMRINRKEEGAYNIVHVQ